MNIVDFYHELVKGNSNGSDFRLFTYKDGLSIGFDSDGHLCAVITSSNKAMNPLMQRTKMISVECNTPIHYVFDDGEQNAVVHIVRSYADNSKDNEIFLELVNAMINKEETSDEEILETFRTLSSFFADRSEPSDLELFGLYAEVETILKYRSLQLENYWQTKDKMKFDFSISDKVKIEVKSTIKSLRTHHFKHDQLVTSMYDIYVLSYMFRLDDEGVSLWDKLNTVKPLLGNYPKKLARIDLIIKNVSEERLKSIKFSQQYIDSKVRVYRAVDVPKFNEYTPDGVANAEYDCNLDLAPYMEESDFIKCLKDIIEGEQEWQG